MTNSSEVSIYLLIDPRDGKPFYAGQSMNPDRRLRTHISTRNTIPRGLTSFTATQKRIQAICEAGMFPSMQIVGTAEDYQAGRFVEDDWIRRLIAEGYNPTNAVTVVGSRGSLADIGRNPIELEIRKLTINQKMTLVSVLDAGGQKHIPWGLGYVSAKSLAKMAYLNRLPGNMWHLTLAGHTLAGWLKNEGFLNSFNPTKLGG